MGLLDKVRVLVGALVHKPFAPRREKANEARPVQADAGQAPARRLAAGDESADAGRVADLIEQRKHPGREPRA